MSFHTTLQFYRPTEPPIVTGADLARFLERLRETATLQDNGWQTLQVKYGERIDADDSEAVWTEPIAPQLSTIRSIAWDIDISANGIQQIVDQLRDEPRHIYRAAVSLGTLDEKVVAPITRKGSAENDTDFLPYELGVEIGLIESWLMGDEQICEVGWMSLTLSGSGYLFPWTFPEVVRQLESVPLIGKLTDVCRSTWPVAPGPLNRKVVEFRRKMGKVWPYEDYDRPWDWYWAAREG
jgi:hypothetical protein